MTVLGTLWVLAAQILSESILAHLHPSSQKNSKVANYRQYHILSLDSEYLPVSVTYIGTEMAFL